MTIQLDFNTITTGHYQAVADNLGVFDIHHGVPTRHDWSTHFTPIGSTATVMHETLLRRKRDCIALANEWASELAAGVVASPTDPEPEPEPEPEVVDAYEALVARIDDRIKSRAGFEFERAEAGVYVANIESGQFLVTRQTPDKWELAFAPYDGSPIPCERSFRSGKAAKEFAPSWDLDSLLVAS